jgi:SAM-dependent methyltransferase
MWRASPPNWKNGSWGKAERSALKPLEPQYPYTLARWISIRSKKRGHMLGSTIDYWILRPFTHNGQLATEEDMNARSDRSTVDLDAAVRRVEKLQSRLEGRFPVNPNLTYLDVGCGIGDIALALAKLGATRVTGLDFVPRYVAAANANRERLLLCDRVEFVCRDFHEWTPPHRYDIVLSHEALEHIHDPKSFLERLRGLMKPQGIAVLAFGPLFFSPFGDHMHGFFRVPIPWRGVFFSEEAVLRLRRQQFRPTDRAVSYPNIVGGLNLLRYSEFLRYVADAGLKFDFLAVNPQLRKLPPLYWISNMFVRTPLIRDYFASSVYAILRPSEKYGNPATAHH